MKKLLLFLSLLLFIGCAVQPSKVNNAKKFMSKTVYVKDETMGLCFALIAISKGANIVGTQEGIGMACVPCDSIPEKLLK